MYNEDKKYAEEIGVSNLEKKKGEIRHRLEYDQMAESERQRLLSELYSYDD